MSASAQASNNRDSPFDRDEHWAGLGLDPDYNNFFRFVLDPDCKSLKKIMVRTGFGPS